MRVDTAADRRLYALFNEALDLDPQVRSQWLAARAQDAPELIGRLRRMLEADAQGEDQDDFTADLHAAIAGAARVAAGEELPARIGGYRVEAKLGEGGMGVVYLARREGPVDAPPVALKLVSERLHSPAARSRFLDEQRSLARLDHPAICRFIDADTLPDGRPMVVMEAVRGCRIDVWVARQRPSIEALLQRVLQLLGAVGHAHERLIVHRDIKCSNVLVTDAGQVKLLDFGIAKRMDAIGGVQATVTAERFLTPGITAPEYWSHGEVTVATDVYALGALLYRLLSGRDPLAFDGLKPTEIERQLLFVEPPPLSTVAVAAYRPGISRDLEAVVQKCLRKSPVERYGSADALAADLRRLLDGYPVLARPSGRVYRARLFARRHRAALAAAALAVAMLSGWALSLRASLIEAERQRAAALAERNRASLVSGLLQESILQADPARRSMEFVGAREIMAAAAQRIDVLEHSEPDTFAELAFLIGRIELEYLRNDEALALAQRGLQALEAAPATELRNELRLLAATAAARDNQLDQAEALLAAYREEGGARNAGYRLAEGRLLTGRGRPTDALATVETGLDALAQRGPEDSLATELRRLRANALLRAGRSEDALQAMDALLEWQRGALPDSHAWVLETRMERLPLLASEATRKALIEERDRLLSGMSELYGDDSLQVAMVHVRSGQALGALDDHAGNAQALAEASRLLLALRGAEDSLYLRLQVNLGNALVRTGRPESILEAQQVLRRAERTATARSDGRSALAVHLRTMLARALVVGDRVEDAVAVIDGEQEASREASIASEYNRRERAALLRLLLGEPALACQFEPSAMTPRCASLRRRLDALEASLGS
ncbi:serine/threonine-protein kinase [uncultured Aquimonas sp.]|uniref:serine/threonine protein kinase n=1 Tax=uncultured Aquimonas sp. TaxID=385483 RepID=UPI00086EEF59|nr:serine/threonine-protein kinase [uncultured Aquimonas sp.]ODU43509.1 MAG: hypothetical protein ABS96_23025 [Xanthomonadaceae bacterium SCN 69-123]